MQITRLRLKDFGCIEEKEWNWPEGIIVLSGDNGSGKSTVLKALALCLFNKTAGNLSDYVRWGAKSYIVEMNFLHQGKSFEMKIAHGSGTERELKIDDQFYKNSDAVAMLAEYFEPKLSLASMISFEGEIDLISVGPSERREHLKKIYDLEFVDAKQKLIDELTEVTEDKDAVILQIMTLKNKAYDLKILRPLPHTEDEDVVLGLQLKSNSFLLQKQEEQQEAVKGYLAEVKELEASQVQLEAKKIVSSTSLSERKQEKLELPLEITAQRKTLTERAVAIQEEKLTLLPTRVSPWSKQDDLVAKGVDRAVVAHKLGVSLKITQMESGGDCPTCFQAMTTDHIAEHAKLAAQYETEEKALELQIGVLLAEKAEIKKIEDSNTEILKQVLILDNEVGQNTLKTNQLNEILKQKEETLTVKITSIEKDLERGIEQITGTLFTIEHLRNQIEEASTLEVDDGLQADVDDLTCQIESFKAAVEVNKVLTAQNKELLEEKQQDETQLEDWNAKKLEYQDQEAVINSALKILKTQFPSYIISDMVTVLEGHVNDFLAATYPKYQIEIQESKNALKVVYGPQSKDVNLASGYEKQVFSFAYKYALSKLQDTRLIILDEVDSAASENNSELFYETLGSMRALYDQIFVITHRGITKDLLQTECQAQIYNMDVL